jgi:two-component system KDP operon response regulator KdpE
VRATLRRTRWLGQPIPEVKGIRRFGPLEIDLEGHIVRRDGEEVRLTPTEFALLAELIANAGKVVPHRLLLQRVWGSSYGDEADYLRVYLTRLRRKLEGNPARPRFLLTVPGVGYRFDPAGQ